MFKKVVTLAWRFRNSLSLETLLLGQHGRRGGHVIAESSRLEGCCLREEWLFPPFPCLLFPTSFSLSLSPILPAGCPEQCPGSSNFSTSSSVLRAEVLVGRTFLPWAQSYRGNGLLDSSTRFSTSVDYLHCVPFQREGLGQASGSEILILSPDPWHRLLRDRNTSCQESLLDFSRFCR